MFKNTASQKLIVYAFDATTSLPKTGDAANLTAYVSKDYGSVTVLGDTSATEMDATNAKGYYLFDLTQAETNADTLLFSAKSVTSNIVVIGSPATVFTVPAAFGLVPGAANGLFIAGTNAATTITTALTTTFTGNLTGSVGSVTGAVGSVTGAVGSVTGNVGGSVASVVGLTASNLDATVSSRLASASYTSPPSAASIATSVFTTGMDSYEGTAAAFSLCELVLGGLNWQIVGTNWVIKKTTGATFASRPVTTTPGVDPITEVG